ncbi:MAG: TetR/AcrR family transcriptional regulator [Bacteroidota bacterium]
MTKPLNNARPRKETILMIAEEAFAQYSFSGTSIRLITKRLGANSAMISYYFGSKEGLYFDIFKSRLADAGEEINRFTKLDLNPPEKLKVYLIAYIKRVAANQNFHRLLCNELVAEQHPSIIVQVAAARKRIYNFLLKTVNDGITKGFFKKVDEEIFVLNVLSLIRSVFTDHLNSGIHLSQSPQDDLTRRIVDYLMSALTIEDQHQIKTKSYV